MEPKIQIATKRPIIVRAYDCPDLIIRAKGLFAGFLQQQTEFQLLLYAALDVRICIEGTLFEYIQIRSPEEIGTKLDKLYRAHDLKKVILRLEPDFLKKIEFLQIANTSIVTPDLDLLCGAWDRLGDYLHRPKIRKETSSNALWWKALVDLLSKTLAHLSEIYGNPRAHVVTFNEKGQALFDKFISGEINAAQIRKEVEDSDRIKLPE